MDMLIIITHLNCHIYIYTHTHTHTQKFVKENRLKSNLVMCVVVIIKVMWGLGISESYLDICIVF